MISTLERVLFLKSIDLFRDMDGEELVRVAQIAAEVTFEPGAVLMSEGEIGDSLYLLAAGRVAVEKGKAKVAEIGARECVGELAMLDSEPRSATVRAIEPVLALKISRDEFCSLLDESGEIARGVIKVLTRRLRNNAMVKAPAPA
ncbi:MAG: cyclic nucleotide-binding domain-containing protein [Deltaproteobacteria bacterium]|nr:cyclic nucleotide-binding domain-containing protein [Deltaproteobacteria bacterium]